MSFQTLQIVCKVRLCHFETLKESILGLQIVSSKGKAACKLRQIYVTRKGVDGGAWVREAAFSPVSTVFIFKSHLLRAVFHYLNAWDRKCYSENVELE